VIERSGHPEHGAPFNRRGAELRLGPANERREHVTLAIDGELEELEVDPL